MLSDQLDLHANLDPSPGPIRGERRCAQSGGQNQAGAITQRESRRPSRLAKQTTRARLLGIEVNDAKVEQAERRIDRLRGHPAFAQPGDNLAEIDGSNAASR